MELWRKIKGYEDYSVSNLGRVRNDVTNNIRKPQKYTKGYLSVRLMNKNLLIHRLVALAFIPNLENKLCVDHINGVRDDNNVTNLRWVTHSENLKGHGNEERSNFHRIFIKAININTGEELHFISKTECAKYFKCHKGNIKINHLYKYKNKANWIFTETKKHKTKI